MTENGNQRPPSSGKYDCGHFITKETTGYSLYNIAEIVVASHPLGCGKCSNCSRSFANAKSFRKYFNVNTKVKERDGYSWSINRRIREITTELGALGHSKGAIAEGFGVGRTTLHYWITMKIRAPEESLARISAWRAQQVHIYNGLDL